MSLTPEDMRERLSKIKLLALDSDGVLTDGGVYISEDGLSFRRFDIKDGLGLRNMLDAGLPVVILSSSPDRSILNRAHTLGITMAYIGVVNKLETLRGICQTLDVAMDQVCYMGDDLPDVAVMQEVGFACTPADAVPEIQAAADLICKHGGGHGAVREVCDILIEFQKPDRLDG